MRTIITLALKGGVGKTETATNMAYSLYKAGNRALILDNDKQGNISRTFQNYNPHWNPPIAKLLSGEITNLENLMKPTQYEGIYIIPANMQLLTETLKLSTISTTEQFTKFKNIKDQAAEYFDYLIIDNPPDIGLNVINALTIADDVIIPVKVDAGSLQGMQTLVEQIDIARQFNKNINPAKILITMHRNDDANAAGVSILKERGFNMFQTKIRYSGKVVESSLHGKPLEEYSYRSAAAVDYRRFVKEYTYSVEGGI